jgi:hypothetical protein
LDMRLPDERNIYVFGLSTSCIKPDSHHRRMIHYPVKAMLFRIALECRIPGSPKTISIGA